MLKSQVDILLESYKRNLSRRRHIAAEIERVKLEIAAIETEAADISASVLTGLPRSGALSDGTAQKAAMLADGTLRDTLAQRETINRLSNELARVELEIEYVENWMNGLSEYEKLVLNAFVIENNKWQSVAASFEAAFGRSACETTLRRIKSTALNKIYAIAA